MLVLAAIFLLIQSTFALTIIPPSDVKPNTKANFSVKNGLEGSPVRLQVHDVNGNILSNSEGVTGTPIPLYIPETSQQTFLVATKLSDNSSITQPFIIGSN
jgi:hypothetical protein